MNEVMAIELAKNAMEIIVTVSAPLLLVGLVVGLLVSVFQTVTSIQDSTLAFVPKMAALVVTIFFLAGWILNLLSGYTRNLLGDFSKYVR